MDQRLNDAEAHSSEAPSRSTPLETFIRDTVEPQRDELNSFGPAKKHIQILLDAARRRKLHTQKIGGADSTTFTLTGSAGPAAGIINGITSLVSDQALRATNSRELTRQCLALSEVPHLPGKTFHVSQGKSSASYMQQLNQPVSVSPTPGSARGGASGRLSTTEEFTDAWDRAAAACADLPTIQQRIEVEAFLPWVPLRVFVVGEEAVAALARVPLYVLGDGSRTLSSLAGEEVQRRSSRAFLQSLGTVDADQLLVRLGLDPQTVLPVGQLRLLSWDRLGQLGQGWSVDVFKQLSAQLAELAINATWAFPGLGATAVDILTPSLSSSDQAVVSGLEPAADLREFRFPAFGVSRFPNRAIMDRLAAVSP